MPKLLALQFLRALAALSVAVLHARHEAGFLSASSSTPAWLPWGAGVDVFFVISGFVMVYASGPLFGTRGAAPVFAARRLARVVPLYWLVTTLYLGLAVASPASLNGATLAPAFVLASYLFIPAARPDGLVQPLYGLGWTLNFEMFFYALFAALLGFARLGAVAILVALLAALVAFGQIAPAFAPLRPPVGTWTDPLLLEFAAGALLGLSRAQGFTLPGAVRIGAAATAIAMLAAAPADDPSGLARPILFGIPAVFAVLACGFGPERAKTGAAPLARAALLCGDASYALYLTHPFALRGVRAALGALGAGATLAGWPFMSLGLSVAVLAAIAVHLGVERPMTRATRRWIEGRFSR